MQINCKPTYTVALLETDCVHTLSRERMGKFWYRLQKIFVSMPRDDGQRAVDHLFAQHEELSAAWADLITTVDGYEDESGQPLTTHDDWRDILIRSAPQHIFSVMLQVINELQRVATPPVDKKKSQTTVSG